VAGDSLSGFKTSFSKKFVSSPRRSQSGSYGTRLERRWIREQNLRFVLRSLGAVGEGEHPVMNGKPQRIRTENDKRGEQTIFYIGHLDGGAFLF
jgi:hypothetical protein